MNITPIKIQMSVTSIKVGNLYWTKFSAGLYLSETFLAKKEKYIGLCLKPFSRSHITGTNQSVFLINNELITVYEYEILKEIQ